MGSIPAGGLENFSENLQCVLVIYFIFIKKKPDNLILNSHLPASS